MNRNPPTRPIQLMEVKPEVVNLRRSLFFAGSILLTAIGIWLMLDLLLRDRFTFREGVILGIFVLLFSQIATGFCLAFFGFCQHLRGGDPLRISKILSPAEDAPMAPTAIVMPVFNESVGRVLKALEQMYTGLQKSGKGEVFDFFILSDSNNPNRWIEEECAWVKLCTKLGAFGRIFYRKRRVPLHQKSGNIADFCRRWGKRYRYMLVLDADSVMSAATLIKLVQLMEANPKAGIIQTAPQPVLGDSLFRRVQQFASSLYSPIFAAGAHYWHFDGGSFWGHNAILRLQAFMDYCDLPELPAVGEVKQHILSHDTVEASLMRRAGYGVWLAYELGGSYEEGPPTLTDSLKRDRRWCQGNLQHFWFLFASGINFANRIHIYMGLMAFLSSPLWMLFMILSSIEVYQKQKFAFLTSSSADPVRFVVQDSALWLFVMTMSLLFIPKLFGFCILAIKERKWHRMPGHFVSTLGEAVFSMILAPILMVFYTKFVFMTWLGQKVQWVPQNREDQGGISWRDAILTYYQPTILGLAAGIVIWFWLRESFWWFSPVLIALVLAIPFAWVTSRESFGHAARRLGLFLIPEEMDPPLELQGLEVEAPLETDRLTEDHHFKNHYGMLQAILDPYVNAIHVLLLRKRDKTQDISQDYRDKTRARLLKEGPEALTQSERLAILWDPASMARLHKELWTRPTAQLHEWWQFALHHYNDSGGSRWGQVTQSK